MSSAENFTQCAEQLVSYAEDSISAYRIQPNYCTMCLGFFQN